MYKVFTIQHSTNFETVSEVLLYKPRIFKKTNGYFPTSHKLNSEPDSLSRLINVLSNNCSLSLDINNKKKTKIRMNT